jgi:predicted nucleic acid-binding protein
MPFVLDASIAIDWALDEGHPTAGIARQRLEADTAVSPILLWFELRNALIIAERRGRAGEDYTNAFLRQLAQFPLTFDAAPDEASVMALARRHRLTVYDAAYLELAQREGLTLATLDRALANAARAEKVPVLGK